MGVVEPISRGRRHYSLTHIVAACLIGVGKVVVGCGKTQGKIRSAAVQSQLIESLCEGEVVVDVVE